MAINKSKKDVLKITEVAQLLNLHVSTVRRWSNNGILKAYRIGSRGDRRFKYEDIVSFLKVNDTSKRLTTQAEDGSNGRDRRY